MQIKIINKSNHELPNYETIASAGMDLRANISEPITLKSLERTIVKTGLFIELPIRLLRLDYELNTTYCFTSC